MLEGKLKRIKYTALLLAPTALITVPVCLIGTPISKASNAVKKLVYKLRYKQIQAKQIEQSKQKLEQLEKKYANSPIGTIERTFDMSQTKKCRITTVNTKYGPIQKREIVYLDNASESKRAIVYSGFALLGNNQIPTHITTEKTLTTKTYSTGTTRDFVFYSSQEQQLWQTNPVEYETSTDTTSKSAKQFEQFVKYFDDQYFKAKENLPMI